METAICPTMLTEDLDPDQMSKNSGASVEKMRSLMNEMKIVQEYENVIKDEDQPS
jgi:hypothetical protein